MPSNKSIDTLLLLKTKPSIDINIENGKAIFYVDITDLDPVSDF